MKKMCLRSKLPCYRLHYLTFNNRFLRERGMASNPKMEYQVFLCIFQKNSAMAISYLRFEGNGKIPLVFIMKSGLDAMPLFLLDNLLNMIDKKLSIPFYNWNNWNN